MAGRIPEDFIQTLLERADIVEIIRARVDLKPAGHEHKACCPFHDEKTPSFYVSPEKQFYHCFGCGAHGTVIGFLMQHDGLEFPAAVEELAAEVGLEVPRTGGAPAPQHDAVYAALDAAAAYYRAAFARSRPARDYLAGRGLDAGTLEEFGVGYAPDAWSALAEALTGKGYSPGDLETAGLITRKDGRLTDRFRDRVIFPIHDRRGRVIAFGGRALSDRGPKYLNSPDTPVFHKGRELYRLFQARRGGPPDRLLVVEGYMDAAALYQHGFRESVATLGTAVTPEQVSLILRTSPLAVFCFDGDDAGRRAAWKSLETALPALKADHELRFLFLPEGEDPDSVVSGHGAKAFADLLDAAVPLSEFFFTHLAHGLDLSTVDGRARLVAAADPLLARLPTGPFADLMRADLKRRTGHAGSPPGTTPVARARPLAPDRPLTPVQYAVALIVQYPDLAASVPTGALDVPGTLRGVDFLNELIDFCRAKPQLSTAVLLERWRGSAEGSFLSALATRNLAVEKDRAASSLAETIERIRSQLIKSRIRELQEQQASGSLDPVQADQLRDLLAARRPNQDT